MTVSKKIVCFTALWIANILLFAHAVVPHHYHEDTGICFISHCKDSREAHHPDWHDWQNHHHEGNPLPDECTVDNDYIHANNKEKIACCSQIKCNCRQIQLTLIENRLNTNDLVEIPQQNIRFKPDHPFFHTDFITQTLGLRAPPVVPLGTKYR